MSISFTVVDVETTGLDPNEDEIIEFAALRVRKDEVVDSYTTLVKPGRRISSAITEITNITNEMLAGAPKMADVIHNIREFIGNDIIMGHNVMFDINFIYNACEKHNVQPLTNDYVDTLRIARRVLPELEHHRLSDIVDYFCIWHENAHRAESDCEATLECYKELRDLEEMG